MNRVCVIGGACVDIVANGITKDILNSPRNYIDSIITSTGGDAFNEAKVLSKLNVDVELISVIGNDTKGNIVKNEIDKRNIYFNPKCIVNGVDTYSTIILNEKDACHYLSTNSGSIRLLSLDNIIDHRPNTKLISFASIFISPLLNNNELDTLFKKYKKEGILLCADMTSPKHNETYVDIKDALSNLDYFMPNHIEASKLCKTNVTKEAANILYNTGVKNVIIKCGKDGVYLKNNCYDQLIESEYTNDDPIDTIGSGDSFAGGFISKIIDDVDIIDAIKFGMLCGYKATKYIGATTWIDSETI